jgi:regulator of sigma E protease
MKRSSQFLTKRYLVLLAVSLGIAVWALMSPHTVRTIGIFAMMLSLLVFVHEWGHFQFARWSGMRVNRFAVGFPPWLWSRRKNGIEYSIGALPIGGMVDIAGLGSEREMVSHLKGEESNPGSPDGASPSGARLFQHTSLGRRFWTLFAGPLMNMIYATVIFIVMYSLVGVPEPYNTNRIDEIRSKSPAIAAGLKQDDYWVGVNAGGADYRSTDVVELKNFVRRSGQTVVTMIVRRGETELRRPLHRLFQEADPSDPLKDSTGKALPLPGLGVRFQIITPYRKLSVPGALQQGWADVVGMWNDLSGLLFRAATVRLTASDRSGLGGPVKIAEMVGQYTVLGWPALIILSGVLSVNLAIMNLLPLPALDGGRILFLGYEWVAGKPLDPKIENRAHALGMIGLLGFMALISLRDLFSIITRFF